MAFQIKDFVSVTASMLNYMRGTQKTITDFQPGSVARTIIEAPAVEIEELYLQMFVGLREAIPVATFQSFGFDKYPASYATGFVTITSLAPVEHTFVIAAGTQFFADDGRVYTSSADVTWFAGQSARSVPVVAARSGAAGNLGAGRITGSNSPEMTQGFIYSNPPIANGTDGETDAEREARFAEYIASLSRGTEVACTYAAKQATVRDGAGDIIERVTRTGFSEIAGYFKIFLYSNLGVPSQALLANAQQLIDGYRDPNTREVLVVGVRAAGIRGDILPMTERPVSMAIGVRMRSGFALTNEVKQSLLDTYSLTIRGVQAGEILLIDELRAILLGVDNVLEIALSSSENILCEQNEALVPGNVPMHAL